MDLLIIDPQNDFCTPKDGQYSGSLVVPGALEDMRRLARMIIRLGVRLDNIHVTLDSHQMNICHPFWWVDKDGLHPSPYTVISVADMESGQWTTTTPEAFTRSLDYLKALDKCGRYPHRIWPEHCSIGSWGHNIVPALLEALQGWERLNHKNVNFIMKGMNPWTEHFSGVQAEVPDPADPSTQINLDLISKLKKADPLLVGGEALSHCLSATVLDILPYFPDVSQIALLMDCMSSVVGFESQGAAFLEKMDTAGVRLCTSTDSSLIPGQGA